MSTLAKYKEERAKRRESCSPISLKDGISPIRKKLLEKKQQDIIEKDHVGLYKIISTEIIEESTILPDGSIKIETIQIKRIQREIQQEFKINRSRETNSDLHSLKYSIEKHLDLIKFSMSAKELSQEYFKLDKIEKNVIQGIIEIQDGLKEMSNHFDSIKSRF
jgi:hypothetical protein